MIYLLVFAVVAYVAFTSVAFWACIAVLVGGVLWTFVPAARTVVVFLLGLAVLGMLGGL